MNQKINALAGIAIILVFAVMGVLFVKFGLGNIPFPNFGISSSSKSIATPEPRGCAMDAKICPDGSAVGRSGLKCEFEPCPGEEGCAKEGESIGAVYPGVVAKKCCSGLVPVIPENIVGTQGICQKENAEYSDWKLYQNNQYGVSLRYPKELELKTGGEAREGEASIADFFFGEDFKMSLALKDGKLDPDSIEGFYGKIEKNRMKTIAVDGRVAYMFMEGDAGCGGYDIRIPNGSNNTLRMRFMDCAGEKMKIENQREKILSTFKFTN